MSQSLFAVLRLFLLFRSADLCNANFMEDPPRVKIPNGISWSNHVWPGNSDDFNSYQFTEVDLFNDQDKIPSLRKQGHLVFCYFSIGTLEGNDYMRPDGECKLKDGKVESCKKNEALWKELTQDIGKMGDLGRGDEVWLDIANPKLKGIMGKRIQLASDVGCHGVEPDNIDCSRNSPCKGNGRTDDVQIAFNRWTAEKAHSLGLSIALKNAGEFVKKTHDAYDCAIVEQCFEGPSGESLSWCDEFDEFRENDQAILAVEYTTRDRCFVAKYYGLSLNYCDGKGHAYCQSDVSMEHCVHKPSSFTKIECTSGYYDYDRGSCMVDGQHKSQFPPWGIAIIVISVAVLVLGGGAFLRRRHNGGAFLRRHLGSAVQNEMGMSMTEG